MQLTYSGYHEVWSSEAASSSIVLKMAKTSFFNSIFRLKAVLFIPPANNSSLHYLLTRISSYQDAGRLFGTNLVGANFSSSSLSNHPKDPNLVDDVRQEGVFRFETSETESMRSRTSSGGSKDNKAKEDQQFINERGGGGTDQQMGSSCTRTDHSNNMGDTAKEGTVRAMETGLKAGEMAKETMDFVWDTTMGTAQKLKDAVAGDDDTEKRRYDVPPTDDLRSKAGGNDFRNRH